jgi:hypothetical protein
MYDTPARRRAVRALAAPMTAAILLASACGNSNDVGVDFAVEHLAARHAAATRVRYYTNLAEALPNVKYQHTDGTTETISESVVRGEITVAESGRGFDGGGEAESTRDVGFESKDALWRTLHLRLKVMEHIAGAATSEEILVGIVIDGGVNPDTAARSFEAMDDVVLLLRSGSPVFDYADKLYSIVQDGGLLGLVGDDGMLTFPVLDESAAQFAGGIATVNDLRAAAEQPERTFLVDEDGGVPMRRPA